MNAIFLLMIIDTHNEQNVVDIVLPNDAFFLV